MIVKDYMDILGSKYPTVQAHLIGDPSVYENIVVEDGSPPLPTKEEMDNVALTSAQADAWLRIQDERDVRKAGGIKIGDDWFHSDDTSRIQQIALVMIGQNMPPGIMWKTMTGEFVQMTPTLALSIFQGIIGQDTKIFANAENLRQAMLASTDDPHDFNVNTGWPQSYADFLATQAT